MSGSTGGQVSSAYLMTQNILPYLLRTIRDGTWLALVVLLGFITESRPSASPPVKREEQH